jgi:hypothetical protein
VPTFRNDTNSPITYNAIVHPPGGGVRKVIITIYPEEEKALDFWVPHVKLGLTLVSDTFPPVPESILANGTFAITAGAERKFEIAPCDSYYLDVIAQTGSVVVYIGNANQGVSVSATSPTAYRYHGVQDWEYAPAIKIVGVADGSFTLSAEVYRGLPQGGATRAHLW